MKRIVAILVLVAISALAGCRKKETFEPSRLFGKTYSGQSLQTVQRVLDIHGGDFTVVEDQRSLNDGLTPPSRLYIISKPNFGAYDTSGELVLTFFNDELVGTKYFVPNPQVACAAVERDQSIALCSGGDAHIDPSTRVWIGKDTTGRSYVGWIDKQRQSALDNWNASRPK